MEGNDVVALTELNKTRTFKYDAVSNLIERVDRLGRKTVWEYDSRYRATNEKWYDGVTLVRTLSFTYDAAGQLLTASDPAAGYGFEYDGLGRVTSETQSLGALAFDIEYESQYDAASNRTELLALVDGAADFKNSYLYDDLNRLTNLQQESGASGPGANVVAEKRVDFAFNAASQFDTITRYADLGGFEFVANTFFGYDGMGRLSSLIHSTDTEAPISGWGDDALAGYEFTYDVGSRITSIDSFIDGLSEYDYDNTSQLTGADHTGQTDESYAYDENGNRTGGGYDTNPNNQLASDGTYDYTYDDEGNRLTKTKISNSEKEEYTWDYRNRLTKVTFKNSGGTVIKTVDFAYDAFDRLIRRTVDPDGATGGASLLDSFFSWEADQINLEFDGGDAGDLVHRNLWNPTTIDQILAVENVASLLSAGEIIWPLTDHLGTPRDLASYDSGTDETTIENHRVYNSFGVLTSETNGSFTIDIGFTGVLFEAATGLNYHRRRWLEPGTGRWMSEDPIGFGAGDTNLQRYVSNGPVSYVDANGLEKRKPTYDEELQRANELLRRSQALRVRVPAVRRLATPAVRPAPITNQCDLAHRRALDQGYADAIANRQHFVVLQNARDQSEGKMWTSYFDRFWPARELHNNVNSIDKVTEVISKYPDGSIRVLVISGHGPDAANGGTLPLTPEDLRRNPELAALIASKLAPGAIVDFSSCQVAATFGQAALREVANLLQATVWANTHLVDQDGVTTLPYGLESGGWTPFPPVPKGDKHEP